MKPEKKILLTYITFFILFLILIIFPSADLYLVSKIQEIRNPTLDTVMLWITNIGSGLIIFFIISTLFLYEERKRRWILPLWLGFLLSSLIVYLLKSSISRPRPFLELGIPAESDSPNSSFPSGHTTMAFAALPVIDKEFRKIKLFWIIFAVLVGFSRFYLAVHHISDVIFGAMLGYTLSLIFVKLEEKKVFSNFLSKFKKQVRK
ncbi:MAG: phosphatase PAP2 family protein [Nanoarchaeota archaeon]